ncbi:iron-sulfur cluster assembly protein, partial [Streptomyces glaucescens]|uniref:iron-sulfur cluster assembly protein n=2 Tax=Streptomyces TaxID=1883 RepID=UPI000A36C59C
MSGPVPDTSRRSPQEVRERVAALPDPELPVIGLGDLGVVGSVTPGTDGVLEVEITPTYLGCPALPEITAAVRDVLAACGHPDGRVRQVLTPPWTTDRITPEGRRRLAEHGIA